MAKFRWTKAALAAREAEVLAKVKLDDTADHETMAEYWARMRKHRAARAREASLAGQKLAAMPKPLKPPSRKADG